MNLCRGAGSVVCKRGQSIVEYVLIMAAILAVILALDVPGRMRTGFEVYFNEAVKSMK